MRVLFPVGCATLRRRPTAAVVSTIAAVMPRSHACRPPGGWEHACADALQRSVQRDARWVQVPSARCAACDITLADRRRAVGVDEATGPHPVLQRQQEGLGALDELGGAHAVAAVAFHTGRDDGAASVVEGDGTGRRVAAGTGNHRASGWMERWSAVWQVGSRCSRVART